MLSARAARRRSLGCLLALTTMVGGAAAIAAGPASADSVRDLQQWVLEAVNAPAAWQVTQGQGVTVAVIDSGVNPDVSDLTGSVITGPDYSGVSTPPTNPNWGMHGTWMASLIAGHGNGFDSGISGISPRAKVLSIRVLPDKPDPAAGFAGDPAYKQYQHEPPGEAQRALAKAIRYAVTHHASVISMSLGYGGSSQVVRSALQDAFDHNVVVVASSGNSGDSASDRGKSQAPYSYPADYPGVLGVAAVNQAGNPAWFSSGNLSVQVAAPGVHVPAQGRDGQIWVVKGTSPACALTAGVAALIKSKYPDLSAALVVRAITSSAQHRPPGGYDDRVGFGTVDAAAALQAAARLTAFGPAAHGILARGHFGGGPSAIPAPPIRSRGLGQLVLFCVLAVACVAITAAAAGRLTAARPYGAADPAGLAALVSAAPRPPGVAPDPAGPGGVAPDPAGPGGARPPGISPESASLRTAGGRDASLDEVALAGRSPAGAVPDEASLDGMSPGEITLDWSTLGEGALTNSRLEDTGATAGGTALGEAAVGWPTAEEAEQPGSGLDDASLDWATMGEVARAGTSLDDATLDWATMDWAALAGAADGAARGDAGPGSAARDNAGPGSAARDDAGPGSAAPDGTGTGEPSLVGTASGGVSLHAGVPEAAGPAASPQAAAADDVVLDAGAAGDDAVQDKAADPDEAAVPDEVGPDFAAPHGHSPGAASPVGIVPGSVARDAAAPDAAAPDGTSPEPAVPADLSLDAAIPQAVAPADFPAAAADAGVTPDTTFLDAAVPDGVSPDSALLDAAVPSGVTPGSAPLAGAGLASTSQQPPAAHGFRPASAVSDAATPADDADSAAVDRSSLGATVPEVAEDARAPDTRSPEAVRPEAVRPETVRPEAMRPEAIGRNGAAAAGVTPDGQRPDPARPPDGQRPDPARPGSGRPDGNNAEPPGRWSSLGRPLRGTVRAGAVPGRHAAPRERSGAIWGRNRESGAGTEPAVRAQQETRPSQEDGE